MKTADFLLELGTCELPPRTLPKLASKLVDQILASFKGEGLTYFSHKVYYTPRRLALFLKDLSVLDQEIEVKGPSVAAAFNDNQPTKATLNFAKNYKVSVNELIKKTTSKGEYLFYCGKRSKEAVFALIPALIQRAITQLSVEKGMYWGNGIGPFVRPVRWLVALLGKEVIPLELFGIKSDRITYGHRFLAPNPITLTEPGVYEQKLVEAFVFADAERRKKQILKELEKYPETVLDLDLLDEVNNLVEFPVVLEGEFDKRFLSLPPEVITTTLKVNQKCFVEEKQGEKLAKFILVSNLVSKDLNLIIKGNEKVVKARLTDAEYFYQEDQKLPLRDKIPSLEKRIFQYSLGTLADKVVRVRQLLKDLAPEIDEKTRTDAACLAKCDLMTNLVGEFPELQGIIGYYLEKKEDLTVALAIREHYLPRFAEDELPASDLGIALALADRLDTLCGIFILGKKPLGDKDPLGLRRMALAIIRLIFRWQRVLDLKFLLGRSLSYYGKTSELVEEILGFIFDRLVGFYSESSFFKVVNNGKWGNLLALDQAVNALSKIENPSWLNSYKRITNLLAKSEGIAKMEVEEKWLQTEGERELWKVKQQLAPQLLVCFEKERYLEYLELLEQFSLPLAKFFDTTMVLVPEEGLKNNRIALLEEVLSFFKLFGNFEVLLRG